MFDFRYNWHGVSFIAVSQGSISLSFISCKFRLNSQIPESRLIHLFSIGERSIIAGINLHPSKILPGYYCASTVKLSNRSLNF